MHPICSGIDNYIKLLACHTCARRSRAQGRRLTAEQMGAVGGRRTLRSRSRSDLAICGMLQQQLAILKQRLTECVKLRADYRPLKTVPGMAENL